MWMWSDGRLQGGLGAAAAAHNNNNNIESGYNKANNNCEQLARCSV